MSTHVQNRRAQRTRQRQAAVNRKADRAAAREARNEGTIMAQTPRGMRRVSLDSTYGRKAVEAQRESTPAAESKSPTRVAPQKDDSVRLSDKAAPKSVSIPVQPWGSGKNDSLEAILTGQGYSLKEIYSKGENGKSLLDQVAADNNLKNPNMIYAGQELNIPAKPKSKQALLSSASTDAISRVFNSFGDVARGYQAGDLTSFLSNLGFSNVG